MTKTVKYICDMCGEPCILEVYDDAPKPTQCPYDEEDGPEWELISGGDELTGEDLRHD